MTSVTFQPSSLSYPDHALDNGKKGKKGKKSKSKGQPGATEGVDPVAATLRSALVRLEDPANRPANFKPLTGKAADMAVSMGLNIPIDPSYEVGSATKAAAEAASSAEGYDPEAAAESGGGMGWLIALLGLGAIGGGAFYYFKVYKKGAVAEAAAPSTAPAA